MRKIFCTSALAFLASLNLSYAEEVNEYPPLIEKIYVKSCVDDDPESELYCKCTMDEAKKTMTFQEFMEMTDQPEDKLFYDERFAKIIEPCISLVK